MTTHVRNATHPIQIRRAERADLPDITTLIAQLNCLPQHQCLHCAEDEAGIRNGIVELGDAPEEMFVVAAEDNQLVGVLGYQGSGDDAFLWGPFVTAVEWEQVTAALLNKLVERFPPTIHTLYTFSGTANQRSHQFFLSHGFRETKTAHIYIATPPADPAAFARDAPCGELEARHIPTFTQLHHLAFPGTPISAQEIVDSLDDDHKVFVYGDGAQVLGYLHATIGSAPVEGYVEYLAVQLDARRQGIGRQLLLTALRWFFEDKGMPQAGLVVHDDRISARALYEQVGFTLAYTGVVATQDRPGDVA